MSEINVAIMDGSEFFRAGVRLKLSSEREFRLTDYSPDQDPLKFIDAHSFDVVLLDIDLLSISEMRHISNRRLSA